MSQKYHRSHERLEEYWANLKGEHQFPKESDIDPDSISDIWPSCFLISIDNVTRRRDYRYSYLGDDLVHAYGDDIHNPDTALRLLSMASMPMVQKFDEVVKTQKPAIDESQFVNLKHLTIKYRTCLVPLGSPDGEVTHILGCMRWRIY